MKIYMLNTAVKRVPTGFSWTTLFFGPIPALLRGDLKWAAIQLLANFAVGAVTFGLGWIITFIVFAVIYNDRYEQDLRAAGWTEVRAEPSAQAY